MKYSAVLSFEGGSLTIKRSGYADKDGSGDFAFKDADLEYDFENEARGATRWINIAKSELVELRDFLNKELPPEKPNAE